jgi:hypothetical protein
MHAKMHSMHFAIFIAFILLSILDTGLCDYENTWNFYYEQPCCSTPTGQHHLRHHRGKQKGRLAYILYILNFLIEFRNYSLVETYRMYIDFDMNGIFKQFVVMVSI